MKIPFEWEAIAHLTDRARVYGGWIVLVTSEDNSASESMVFIPDPDHKWEIEATP